MNKNMEQLEAKKKENEEASNKAVRMVVINTSIGLFLKLPICILPLFNLIVQFTFDKLTTQPNNFIFFYNFYKMLIATGFFGLMIYLSDLLYSISISILLLVYNQFDKKFKTGYDRLKKKNKAKELNS